LAKHKAEDILEELLKKFGRPYSVVGLLNHEVTEQEILTLMDYFKCEREQLYEVVTKEFEIGRA